MPPRRHILSAMIVRYPGMTHGRNASTHRPFLLEQLNIAASTAHGLRTRHPCQPTANYRRPLRQATPPVSLRYVSKKENFNTVLIPVNQ